MTTTRKGTKKTARRSSDSISSTTGGVEVGNYSKRSRTDTDINIDIATATATAAAAAATAKEEDTNTNNPSQAVSLDNVNSASESNNAVTTNTNDDYDDVDEEEDQIKELPTPIELSQELCKIVSDRYSRDESLRALNNLYIWAFTEDADFLKWFDIHGGIVKVLDFLKATMNDSNCKGSIRMECIEKAADVISTVTFGAEDAINNEITTKIATTLLDCDGINTLIAASEEYTGGKDVPQLNALSSVWRAFRNTFILTDDSLMNQKTASTIFDAGIDAMSQLKSIGGLIASEILKEIFCTFYNIVFYNHLTKKYFQDKNILSKCLEVLKRNGLWTFERCEGLIQEATEFFDYCCEANLLDNSSDYEMILPLLVIALKKFPSNDEIRKNALRMMNRSCSTINDKKIIERSGALEVLVALLASDDTTDEAEKDTVRTLIGKIVA